MGINRIQNQIHWAKVFALSEHHALSMLLLGPDFAFDEAIEILRSEKLPSDLAIMYW